MENRSIGALENNVFSYSKALKFKYITYSRKICPDTKIKKTHILPVFEVLEIIMRLPIRNFRFFICFTSIIQGLSSGPNVFFQHIIFNQTCSKPRLSP